MNNKSRILVVEDSGTIAMHIERVLRLLEYRIVDVVDTAAQAIARVEASHPDLVLMDITLKGEKDGIATAEEIWRRFRTPVIYLTAHDDEKTLQRALLAEPFGYVLKPFEVEDIRIAIETALSKHKTVSDLFQNEQFVRSILSSLDAHISVVDQDGVIIAVNEAWEKFARANGDPGLTATCEGRNYLDVCRQAQALGNQDAEKTLQGLQAVLASTQQNYTLEYPCHAPSEKRWFRLSITPLAGERTGAVISHINITERVVAEENTQAVKARLEHLLANSPTVIYSSAAAGDFGATFISQNVRQLLGYEPGEFIEDSKFWAEHIHPEDAPKVFADLPQLLEKGSYSHKYRFLHGDGDYRWMQDDLMLVSDRDGNPLEIIGSWADITERVLAEQALRESEARLSAAQRLAHLGNWEWDIINNHLHWSDEIYRIFGLAPQEFGATYDAFLESVHPDDRQEVVQSVDAALTQGFPYSIDHRILRQDGIQRIVHEQAEIMYDQQGKAIRMIGTVQDITERKRSEAALRESEKRMRAIVDTAVEGIITINLRGIIESFNQAAERIFGYASKDVVGKNIKMLMPDPYHSEHDGYLENYLGSGQAKVIGIGREVTGQRADGSTFPMSLAVSEVYLGEQRIFTGIVQDISERVRLQSELTHMATTDALTGVNNRGHFITMAQAELVRSQRYDHNLLFLMMDIDHFKKINDTYGHPVGDDVLKTLAMECGATLRESDIFGRLGGEEFAAVLVESDAKQAYQVAERLRQNLAALVMETDNGPLRFTVSIGLAALEEKMDLDEIMKAADVALYRAKENGRNLTILQETKNECY